jgi:16S rRNA (uracil1498-N3)-methyltransferase
MIPEEGKEGWERQLAAAGKQCGAVWLPRIRTFSGPGDLIRASAAFGSKVLCWEQAEDAFVDPPLLAHPLAASRYWGPKARLEAQEASLFREHGFTPVSLGRNILRFETAAVLILSLHLWAAPGGTPPESARPFLKPGHPFQFLFQKTAQIHFKGHDPESSPAVDQP